MSIPSDIIDHLLYENEGPALHYRRDQYAFEGASEADKGELLKDMLALANAWRRGDAYMLAGAEPVRNGRGRVVGVAGHLDNARLHEFLNSLTQQPLHFSYHAVSFEGKDLGVIHIPPQDRPIFLNRNFGKLKKNKVYVRRGSSTTVADADEVAKMGGALAHAVGGLPILEAAFCDSVTLKQLGPGAPLNVVELELPEESAFPDYGLAYIRSGPRSSIGFADATKNRHFWRESAKYLQESARYGRVEFMVSNSGHVAAYGVRLECEIEDPDNALILADATALPDPPSTELCVRQTRPSRRAADCDVSVRHHTGKWMVTASVGKIQPRNHAHTKSGLFIATRGDRDVTFPVILKADNLPTSAMWDLSVAIRAEKKPIGLEKLMTLLRVDACSQATGGQEK
ncbi:MAG: ATP-binding protein [Planctomycetota bacterium]|nr:ATP-binding protein [Planctomycetota bacterium]